MSVYKDQKQGTWYVSFRYVDWTGEKKQKMKRGFIRAEVVSYDNLVAQGSMNAAKEKGLVRSEGKEYVVQDGDVVLFRFNV